MPDSLHITVGGEPRMEVEIGCKTPDLYGASEVMFTRKFRTLVDLLVFVDTYGGRCTLYGGVTADNGLPSLVFDFDAYDELETEKTSYSEDD